ncbi:Transposase_IS4 [Hexamita inflata]|uniref:Transposase IS4 n=1 Tax=Hexamita inflata TaxID=28002 RepID=A0AA86RI78_9EUKA|nr:Transposase IS4 [Hexamita inflata]
MEAKQVDPDDPIQLAFQAFSEFFTPDIIARVIFCTENKMKDRYGGRETFTDGDFWSFILVLFSMMVSPRKTIAEYWSSNKMFSNDYIKQFMSREHFKQILNNLWFEEDVLTEEQEQLDPFLRPDDTGEVDLVDLQPQLTEEEFADGLKRMQWLLNEIQVRFRSIYATEILPTDPKLDFSLDETMVAYRGWTPIRMYLKDKPDPFGFLVRVIALACYRFIVEFELFVGIFKSKQENQLINLVLRLVSGIYIPPNRGKPVLFADSYYSTYDVLKRLGELNWNFVMTIQMNRFKDACTKLKEIGETHKIENPRNLNFQILEIQVKKTKTLRIAHSIYTQKQCEVKRYHKKPLTRPQVQHEYIKNYSVIDRLDQFMSGIAYPHKSKKWQTKIFIYCLHLCILNGFSLFKFRTKKLISIRGFVIYLIKAMEPKTNWAKNEEKIKKEVNDIITNHYLIPMRVFKPEQSDPRTGCTLCNGIARHRCSCNLGMCMTCYTRHCLEQQIRLSQKEVEK